MLTGDKLETAENIAKSCKLIQGDMTVMRFSEGDVNSLRDKLLESREVYNLCVKEKRKKVHIKQDFAISLGVPGGGAVSRADSDHVAAEERIPQNGAQLRGRGVLQSVSRPEGQGSAAYKR